jgi:hypothetical protein
MQSDPDRLRLALDNGEVVELDGGTVVLGDDGVAVGGAAVNTVAGSLGGAGIGGVVGDFPSVSSSASAGPE